MLPDYWEGAAAEGEPPIALDLRWMGLPGDLDATLAGPIERAFVELAALEAGAIANPDEGRQVGHYWLRAPELAPPGVGSLVAAARDAVRAAVARVAGRFSKVLVIGIGGSALGPQLVADALGSRDDKREVLFFDNTDPDGMSRVLARAEPLTDTLCVVISKSGGTAETRNGMLVAKAAYEEAGLDFGPHAMAVTQEGSALDKEASRLGFIVRLPMWDWVGGRTSVTSVVGLLPAALQGLDVDLLIEGARVMDAQTRIPRVADNPAMLLALAWWHAGQGRGDKAMVVLPYKDRLLLMSRYLQQLVMESLGKRLDRQGREVHQGLAVYGNKGSTDQHAYVQQLRDGRADFFATFIEVLEDGPPHALATALEVEPGVTSGDYLEGFLAGTRKALDEAGRRSLTITLPWVDAATVGALIALFERAVSLYASLVDVNAYHQPGVEAGKKAAGALLALQKELVLLVRRGAIGTADELAVAVGADARDVFHVMRHLAANGRVACVGHGLARRFGASLEVLEPPAPER
ncbi:MAG: glucose-6-phosphate isomerase [Deltaproteobacteria bacterium]|nr:glucose-6-phosphate isomerase [Deltaproteobacteria bacterium]